MDTFWDLEKLKRPDYSEVSDFEFSYHGQSGLFLITSIIIFNTENFLDHAW